MLPGDPEAVYQLALQRIADRQDEAARWALVAACRRGRAVRRRPGRPLLGAVLALLPRRGVAAAVGGTGEPSPCCCAG